MTHEELRKEKFYETEKLDGSSETIYLKDGVFGVTSRNIDLIETETNSFWKVARELDIENKMRIYAEKHGLVNFNVQGELIGEGIQENKYVHLSCLQKLLSDRLVSNLTIKILSNSD